MTSNESAEIARFAGFWRRTAAWVIDSLVLGIISVVLITLLVLLMSASGPQKALASAASLYASTWLVAWLYYALMHSSSWQATPGKRAVGIKVTSLEGERIGFLHATGRYVATLVSTVMLGVGYLMAAFTARKQALHDMIAGTLVVSSNATPADISAGLAPPRVSGGVIALGLVAGIVPTSGILAALAVPAYQDYLIRSQVAEGLVLANAYKAAIVGELAKGSDYQAIDNGVINIPETPEGSKYVTAITVQGSAIQISYGREAHPKIRDTSILLVPGMSKAGDIVWTCGYAEAPAGVVPYLEDYRDYTSIDSKFLPRACREQK